MALDKLTLLDETIVSNTATTAATTVVNNSAQTNYISYPVAVGNPLTNGWRVYSDGASVSPVDGTGGSPNTTLTQNTSSPLNSTGDFRVTKTSGASRQGEGISTDFTIANRHLAKVLQISFDYELITGSLATDDIRVYIIQDPSGTPLAIEPASVSVQGINSGTRIRHLAIFQTHISVTSYRLCVHIATTTNSNQTIDFNNFRVWEQTQSIGAIITEPILYTPTLTNIPLSTSSLYFHREGAYGFIQGTITLSGVGNAGEARVGLPSGWVISSIISSIREVGRSVSSSTGFSSPGWQGVILAEGGTNYLTFGRDTATTSGLAKLQGNDSSFASLIYTINAKVPIAGWGSSVAMSSDTGDSRVVAARYINGSANAVSTSIPFHFNTLSYDTHGGITKGSAGSSGAFFYTAPVSGYYRISCCVGMNSTNGVSAFVNDVDTILLGQGTNGILTNYSGQVFLNAGQKVDIRPNSGSFTSVSNANNFFAIERISAGSQVIATSESIAMTATKTTGSIAGNGAVTSWNTATLDTHGGWSATLGEYTVPVNGVYIFYATANDNSGINNTVSVRLQTNISGSFADISGTSDLIYNTTASIWPNLRTTMIRRCIAGEKIRSYSVYSGSGFPAGIWTALQFSAARIGI